MEQVSVACICPTDVAQPVVQCPGPGFTPAVQRDTPALCTLHATGLMVGSRDCAFTPDRVNMQAVSGMNVPARLTRLKRIALHSAMSDS